MHVRIDRERTEQRALRDFSNLTRLLAEPAGSPAASERARVAAAAVRGFPLGVLGAAGERSVLAPWREESWRVSKRTLRAPVAMVALIGLAAWGLVRRERTRQRREKQFRGM